MATSSLSPAQQWFVRVRSSLAVVALAADAAHSTMEQLSSGIPREIVAGQPVENFEALAPVRHSLRRLSMAAHNGRRDLRPPVPPEFRRAADVVADALGLLEERAEDLADHFAGLAEYDPSGFGEAVESFMAGMAALLEAWNEVDDSEAPTVG